MKNAGNIEETISEEKSLKKLVSPRKKTVRGRPRILSFISTTLSSAASTASSTNLYAATAVIPSLTATDPP